MPSAGPTDPSPVVQSPHLKSSTLNEDDEKGDLVLPRSRDGSPESRVASARSRRSDPAGLITDLTRLKEITHDERILSPTYRKFIPEFGNEELQDQENQLAEPRDTIFYGQGQQDYEDRLAEVDEDLENLDDEVVETFGEDLDNVSSIGSDDETREEEYDTDLEVDADKIVHPERYQEDTSGKAVYLRKCEEVGVQPATYFIKHMHDTHLVMKYHGLGPQGMKAVAGPLEINTVIEKIDLEGNFILGEGTMHLTRVLKENVYVTDLVLCDNKIGNDGAKAICELLTENKTIIHLNLAGNDIEDPAAESFYEMLSHNSAIKTLMLRHNKFEDTGAYWFCESLNDNVTLERLDISWNRFQTKGCVLLAQGLKENVGLKYLDASMNGFGLDGAKALEEALKENKYLIELNLSYCRIPTEGAPYIGSGLQVNDTLQDLNIGYNPVGADGGYSLIVGLDRNDSSAMQVLNLGNLMVRKNFKELETKLREERKIKIIYGGVLLDIPRFRKHGSDPFAALMNDPMTKLKDYVEKSGYRMIDLLKSFDKDQSFTISLEELKEGIRKCNIDLTDPQIMQLMKQLDKDGNGEIDFSELLGGDYENRLKKREAKAFLEQQKKQQELDPDSFSETV